LSLPPLHLPSRRPPITSDQVRRSSTDTLFNLPAVSSAAGDQTSAFPKGPFAAPKWPTSSSVALPYSYYRIHLGQLGGNTGLPTRVITAAPPMGLKPPLSGGPGQVCRDHLESGGSRTTQTWRAPNISPQIPTNSLSRGETGQVLRLSLFHQHRRGYPGNATILKIPQSHTDGHHPRERSTTDEHHIRQMPSVQKHPLTPLGLQEGVQLILEIKMYGLCRPRPPLCSQEILQGVTITLKLLLPRPTGPLFRVVCVLPARWWTPVPQATGVGCGNLGGAPSPPVTPLHLLPRNSLERDRNHLSTPEPNLSRVCPARGGTQALRI